MHPFVQPTVRLINWMFVLFVSTLALQGLGFIRVFGAGPFWDDFLNLTAIAVIIQLIAYVRTRLKDE
jgi:hypothetical protein